MEAEEERCWDCLEAVVFGLLDSAVCDAVEENLEVIDLVESMGDGLPIGIDESIQVRFVWHATLATERVAFAAAA